MDATDSVPLTTSKDSQTSPFTQRQPSSNVVQKRELYCFLIEDRNQSSANLFSGLRSGVWCDETQSALP